MQIEQMRLFHDFSNLCDFSITSGGFVRTDASWHQDPLPSPISRLYYVMDGSGMLLSDDEQMPLEPGFVYLAPCGMACGFYGTASVTKLFFHINLILPDGYDLFASCRHFARIPRAKEYMQRLLSWYAGEDAAGYAMLKGEIWNTVSAFAERLLPPQTRRVSYSDPVAGAIAYIREHLSAGLTVGEVANAVFCSPGTLSAAFRKELGSSVARYIEDLLMFEVRRMLLSTDRTIGRISDDFGFCDQFYFSRRFRKRFAVSPREYRKLRAET